MSIAAALIIGSLGGVWGAWKAGDLYLYMAFSGLTGLPFYVFLFSGLSEIPYLVKKRFQGHKLNDDDLKVPFGPFLFAGVLITLWLDYFIDLPSILVKWLNILGF
ncbi:MAG: hypothetical protein ACOC5T_05440 [Elusimicrobiota bacterium]